MDKRVKNTEEKLHRVVIELLVEKSYQGISINDICVKAGIKRPTFYNHYENKDDFAAKTCYKHFKSIIKESGIGEKASFKTYFLTLTEGYLKLLDKYRSNIASLSDREDFKEINLILGNTCSKLFEEKIASLYPYELNKSLIETFSDAHVGVFLAITNKFVNNKDQDLNTLMKDLKKVFNIPTIEKDFKK